jgi:hypothetical protein
MSRYGRSLTGRFVAASLLLALALGAGPQAGGKTTGNAAAPPVTPSNRRNVTLRGEIVDYFCYIEKGYTGQFHKACGLRCVAGDVCMGLLTTDGALYMLSVNHLRAMDPLGFRGIPDPFTTCRGWIAETVDLSGVAMERKGQKIIEVMNVKKASGPPPSLAPPSAGSQPIPQ